MCPVHARYIASLSTAAPMGNVVTTKPNEMKKALGETQTLHAGWSKAEPNIIAPAADPLPGGAGPPKFNQLEMVTTFTYRPSLVKVDAHNFKLTW